MSLKSPTPASVNHPNYDENTINRIQKNIKIVSDCWIWTQHVNWNGYAIIRYKNKDWRVHRLSYLIIGKKSLTPGMVLDHLCRNRSCVNPNHLEEVTHKENLRRGKGFGWVNRKLLKV